MVDRKIPRDIIDMLIKIVFRMCDVNELFFSHLKTIVCKQFTNQVGFDFGSTRR